MDATRVLPVNKLVLHHAVTPLWEDKSKAWLAQWFSDNGFVRAYGSNSNNWSGLINPYTGGRSYSQAQYAGQRVTSATPDATAAEKAAGYRLVPLVKDPFNWVCWHAGNWGVNQSSIGIENLGDYRNYTLRDGDCRVIADFWRAQDTKLGGATNIYLHREVSQTGTECPARIAEVRNLIVNYVNTKPTPTPQPTPNIKSYAAIPKTQFEFNKDANLWDFNADSQASMKAVKSFKKGERIDITGKAIYKTGTEYLMTAYSFGSAATTGKPTATNGFNAADLKEVKAPVITTKEETQTEPVAFPKETKEDANLLEGEKVITQQGKNGVRTIVYTITYTDGKETSRAVKSNTITTQPVTEITSIGTKPKTPETPDPTDGEDAASWLSRVWEWVKEVLKSFTFKK